MKRIVVIGPAFSLSGYGTLTRFILKGLSLVEDFDVYLHPTSWGDSSWIYDDSDFRNWMDHLVYKLQNNQAPLDISVQVTVPNEWQRICPINIGITAGLETDRVPEMWIDKSKNVDKILVTSKHSMDSFVNTIINGKQLTIPIDFFHLPINEGLADIKPLDFELETDFNFISIAQWAPRKNMEATIRWFIEEFHNEPVGLVVKTHGRNNSKIDRHALGKAFEDIIGNYPYKKCKIYLLHGLLTEEEVCGIYKHDKIKAFCSTTHGEGYGLPMFEMASEGKPLVLTNWSSYLDFLKFNEKDYFLPVGYKLKEVAPDAYMENIILPGFKWAYPDEFSFKAQLRKVYENYEECKNLSLELKGILEKEFSPEKIYVDLIQKMFNSFGTVQQADEAKEEEKVLTYE